MILVTARFDPRMDNCRTVRTKREAFAVFRLWSSPRIITVGLLTMIVIRVLIGSWSWWDLVATAI